MLSTDSLAYIEVESSVIYLLLSTCRVYRSKRKRELVIE